MEIVKKDLKYKLIEDELVIEEYDFESEINFKKLIDYLLSKNLDSKINNNIKIDGVDETEKVLYSIIKDLIDDYNSKVEEFNEFKKMCDWLLYNNTILNQLY